MPPPAVIEFVNRKPISVIVKKPAICQVADLAMVLVVVSICKPVVRSLCLEALLAQKT